MNKKILYGLQILYRFMTLADSMAGLLKRPPSIATDSQPQLLQEDACWRMSPAGCSEGNE
jgi:hypothetical protein